MKLHTEAFGSLNTVTAYGPGFIEINAVRFEHAVVLMPEGLLQSWPITAVEGIESTHIEALMAHKPDVIILGTGARQRFLHPRVTSPATSAHVGVEAMDSQAASRTYNILMAEGRRVLAAVLV
jgi:uncharacterized protein